MITNKRKYTCFYKIIHFFMQFSAVEIRFIVTTLLYSTFANDLKRFFFSKKMFIVTEYAALSEIKIWQKHMWCKGSNMNSTHIKCYFNWEVFFFEYVNIAYRYYLN